MWDDPLPSMDISSISDAMQPTLRECLKRASNQISYLETPTREYYCFLDGFSGYFQIPIDPKDQEKPTFTCPYGTFAYHHMPFGLCNAPGTFQRTAPIVKSLASHMSSKGISQSGAIKIGALVNFCLSV
nr:reverse transcriptase domain-containing protein [Tanacetum cinerariifolium]